MGDKKPKENVALVEDAQVNVLQETQESLEKGDYPPAGNSIYSAILSRNEAVKDAKRLKTFLELRDKYVKKKVLFEDPLFPAKDSSLYYCEKPPMKFEWKRPSVSASLVSSLTSLQTHFSKIPVYLITSSTRQGWGVRLMCLHGCYGITLDYHLP